MREYFKQFLESQERVPALAVVEREYVLAVLERYRGNRRRTSEVLGISLRALQYKLKRYKAEGHDVPHNLSLIKYALKLDEYNGQP